MARLCNLNLDTGLSVVSVFREGTSVGDTNEHSSMGSRNNGQRRGQVRLVSEWKDLGRPR